MITLPDNQMVILIMYKRKKTKLIELLKSDLSDCCQDPELAHQQGVVMMRVLFFFWRDYVIHATDLYWLHVCV